MFLHIVLRALLYVPMAVPSLCYLQALRTRQFNKGNALTSSTVDDWVLSNGGAIGHIKTISMDGEGIPGGEREVLATKLIQKGEVVLAVPRACILNKIKAQKTTIGRILSERGDTLSCDNSYIALLLCEEIIKNRFREESEI